MYTVPCRNGQDLRRFGGTWNVNNFHHSDTQLHQQKCTVNME
jgi:hypothetical protein